MLDAALVHLFIRFFLFNGFVFVHLESCARRGSDADVIHGGRHLFREPAVVVAILAGGFIGGMHARV